MPVFDLIEESFLPIQNSRAQFFRHTSSGAHVLSISNRDPMKVFAIGVRTPPFNSSGVFHAIEHMLMECASAKYPPGWGWSNAIESLAHSVNSATSLDFTSYYVESPNRADLYAHAARHLDAVVAAKLEERTFRNEVWRIGPAGEDGSLRLKGTLYGEMIGYLHDLISFMSYQLRIALAPSPYRHLSFGLPGQIQNLTLEDVKRAYSAFYYPGNCLVSFWGDDPLPQRLALVDQALAGFSPKPPISFPGPGPVLNEPVQVDVSHERSALGLGWVIPWAKSTEDAFILHCLGHLFLEKSDALLRVAVEQLGEKFYSGGAGLWMRPLSLSLVVPDCPVKKFELVQETIWRTLERAVAELDPEQVLETVNSMAYGFRDFGYSRPEGHGAGHTAFWLQMIRWVYDSSPLDILKFPASAETVKRTLTKNPAYFRDIVAQWLLQNPNYALVRCLAQPDYETTQEAEEKGWIQAKLDKMAPAEIEVLSERTEDSAPFNPTQLGAPLISVDQAGSFTPIPAEVRDRVVIHRLPTCGDITYLDLAFDLHALPLTFRKYALVMGHILTEAYNPTLQARMNRCTGGIDCATIASEPVEETRPNALLLLLSGRVQNTQVPDLLEILVELASQRTFQRDRVLAVLTRMIDDLESSLEKKGWLLAEARIRACYSLPGWLMEAWQGAIGIEFLWNLYQRAKSDWDQVNQELSVFCRLLLRKQAAWLNVTTGQADLPDLLPLLDRLPDSQVNLYHHTCLLEAPNPEFIETLTPYFFTAASFKLEPSSTLWPHLPVAQSAIQLFHFTPRLKQMVKVFGLTTLWENAPSGLLIARTLRDPSPTHFYDLLAKIPEFLSKLKLTQGSLTRVRLGGLRHCDFVDHPHTTGREGLVRVLTGTTDEELAAYRDRLLGTTVQDLRRVGQALEIAPRRLVVVGNEAPPEGFIVTNLLKP